MLRPPVGISNPANRGWSARSSSHVRTLHRPIAFSDADLVLLTAAVQSNGLVTLTGIGGVGNTRLALAAAARRRGRPRGPCALEVQACQIGHDTEPQRLAETRFPWALAGAVTAT